MIAQYISGHQSSWDELLPEISLAVNTSVADSTGFSPAFMMQGREPRLPASLYHEATPGSASTPQTPSERAQKLREIFDIARTNMQRASRDQGRHHNLRRREWRPTLRSAVLVRTHQLSNAGEGFAAKLSAKYEGPFIVKSFISPNIVRLVKEGEKKSKVANIAQLKPYHRHEDDTGDV
ncbi:hypothetical protein KR222_010208, partial [Zaprionus bogoriensis]